MRVIIETEVFAATKNRGLSLPNLFYAGLRQRHRIQVRDDRAKDYLDWYNSLPQLQQEDCRLVLDDGYERDTGASSAHTIIVAEGATDWSVSPPRLSIDDAIDLLKKPFRILLENSTNDKNFLLAFATTEDTKLLLDWENRGWLIFDHGGGIAGIQAKVEQAKRQSAEPLLLWVIFDSDSLGPDLPSKQTKECAKECGQKIPFHRLQRRNIENYLPVSALSRWAENQQHQQKRDEKLKIARAIQTLTATQRHHFNMKGGFGGDANRDDLENVGNLYDDLDASKRTVLNSGFGGSVGAEIYGENARALQQKKPATLKEIWLDADGSLVEMRAALQKLMAKIR